MRKLGVDLGQVRIGLALSDALNIFASALETYHRKSLELDLKHIADVANAKDFTIEAAE